MPHIRTLSALPRLPASLELPLNPVTHLEPSSPPTTPSPSLTCPRIIYHAQPGSQLSRISHSPPHHLRRTGASCPPGPWGAIKFPLYPTASGPYSPLHHPQIRSWKHWVGLSGILARTCSNLREDRPSLLNLPIIRRSTVPFLHHKFLENLINSPHANFADPANRVDVAII